MQTPKSRAKWALPDATQKKSGSPPIPSPGPCMHGARLVARVCRRAAAGPGQQGLSLRPSVYARPRARLQDKAGSEARQARAGRREGGNGQVLRPSARPSVRSTAPAPGPLTSLDHMHPCWRRPRALLSALGEAQTPTGCLGRAGGSVSDGDPGKHSGRLQTEAAKLRSPAQATAKARDGVSRP